MKTIGQVITEKRRAARMTQKELSERLGIAQTTLSGYEKGVFFPNAFIVVELADIFQCTTDELYCRDIPLKELRETMWKLVRYEGIVITNQNIDWLLERAEKKLRREKEYDNSRRVEG